MYNIEDIKSAIEVLEQLRNPDSCIKLPIYDLNDFITKLNRIKWLVEHIEKINKLESELFDLKYKSGKFDHTITGMQKGEYFIKNYLNDNITLSDEDATKLVDTLKTTESEIISKVENE